MREESSTPPPSDRDPHVTPPRRPLSRNVKLLGAASLLNDIASEMIFPIMPQFLLTMVGGSKEQLGLIEGAADALASLLKLASGGWSDRLRRRKWLVVAGYLLAALTRPLASAATRPWHLLAIRLADRTGKGIRTTPRDALIAESTEPDNRGRAFGFHRAMDHLGASLGPAMAAAFLWFRPDDLRLLFFLTIVPGLAVVALLVFGLRDVAAPPAIGAAGAVLNGQHSWSWRAFGGDLRIFLVAMFLFALGNSTDAFLLVRATDLGVPVWSLPLLWFVFHVAKSAGNLIGGGWVDRFGARPVLVVGWLIYALVYLGFALATSAWHVGVLFGVYALYYALAEPAEKTLVVALAAPEHKGLALGWFHFVSGVALLPASVLFGWLYEQPALGAPAAFCWGAVLALAATALLFCMPRTSRSASAGSSGAASPVH